jgi:flagellum-specific peptidoglycan hydrolase FlgJ
MLAQIALETGHFKSVASLQDNNLTGIKFFGQTGATKGIAAPNRNGDNGNYAHYNSYDDWAKDYMRILSSVGTANPLEATTPEDFAAALKQNGYFQSDEKTYANNIASLANSYAPFIDILQPVLNFA